MHPMAVHALVSTSLLASGALGPVFAGSARGEVAQFLYKVVIIKFFVRLLRMAPVQVLYVLLGIVVVGAGAFAVQMIRRREPQWRRDVLAAVGVVALAGAGFAGVGRLGPGEAASAQESGALLADDENVFSRSRSQDGDFRERAEALLAERRRADYVRYDRLKTYKDSLRRSQDAETRSFLYQFIIAAYEDEGPADSLAAYRKSALSDTLLSVAYRAELERTWGSAATGSE